MYKEVEGDLIDLAIEGTFDAIAHGCNCLCNMGAGIAVPMKNMFECDKYPLEDAKYRGDINKLGQIEYRYKFAARGPVVNHAFKQFAVINAYTQYRYGKNHADGDEKPFDYDAFTLCMRKINHIFKGKHIGLPKIGSHLAGGYWDLIKVIIQKELKDCDVTVVVFKP